MKRLEPLPLLAWLTLISVAGISFAATPGSTKTRKSLDSVSQAVAATPSSIEIEADHLEYLGMENGTKKAANQAGTLKLSGKVSVRHNGILLLANSVWVKSFADGVGANTGAKLLIATGSPARFRQMAEGTTPSTAIRQIDGQADYLEYHSGNRQLEMRGQAEITENTNHISAERIFYNADTLQYQADAQSNSANADGKPKQRVKIILTPDAMGAR